MAAKRMDTTASSVEQLTEGCVLEGMVVQLRQEVQSRIEKISGVWWMVGRAAAIGDGTWWAARVVIARAGPRPRPHSSTLSFSFRGDWESSAPGLGTQSAHVKKSEPVPLRCRNFVISAVIN